MINGGLLARGTFYWFFLFEVIGHWELLASVFFLGALCPGVIGSGYRSGGYWPGDY